MKNIRKYCSQFIIGLTIAMLLVGGVWGILMYILLPDWWFPLYPVIPGFLYLMGWAQVLLFVYGKDHNQNVMNTLLIQRLIRWFIVIVVLVLMLVFSDPPKVSFLLSFMVLYIIFSSLELSFVSKVTKKVVSDNEK